MTILFHCIMHTISQFIGTINVRSPPRAGKSSTLRAQVPFYGYLPNPERQEQVRIKRDRERERERKREMPGREWGVEFVLSKRWPNGVV